MNDESELIRLVIELERDALRSHETHMKHIYGLRWGGLALSGLTIAIGAVMIFMGLQGSFDWAVEAPNSIQAKLTNASPGIVFATVGMLIGLVVAIQKPVNYSTGSGDFAGASEIERIASRPLLRRERTQLLRLLLSDPMQNYRDRYADPKEEGSTSASNTPKPGV